MERNFKRRMLTAALLPLLSLSVGAAYAEAADSSHNTGTIDANASMAGARADGASTQATNGGASRPSSSASVDVDVQQKFERLDADGDGFISRGEARADPWMISAWGQLDRTNSGRVSREELERFARSHQGTQSMSSDDDRMGAVAKAMQAGRDFRASALIGANVRNPQGDDVGHVRDIVLDVRSGQVKYAIVSFDGALAVADKLFPFPLAAFSAPDNGNDLVLDVNEQKLESARGFDRNEWPRWTAAGREGAKQQHASGLWRASRVLGRDVSDRDGEHLGEIKDLMISPRTGRIDQAILQYDRPWSLDNPLVALPLDSFNFRDGRHEISMDADKSQLDAQQKSGDDLRRALRGSPDYDNAVIERWILLVPQASAAGTAASPSASPAATSTDPQASMATGTRTSAGQAGGNTPMGPMTSNGSGATPNFTSDEFKRFDIDNNAQLSPPEAVNHAGVQSYWEALDKDGDDRITRDEYTAGGTPDAPK